MSRPDITLVLARAANGVIGADGKMPWHLPADLRRFKQLTMGRPMIMGRKTFDSLPALLEGRRHIGVTAGASAPDVLVQGVIARLRDLGAGGLRELDGEPESMVFALPKELRVQLVD